MSNRKENNKVIVQLLSNAALLYPDIRFIQLLTALKITTNNNFYEESSVTAEKAKLAFNDILTKGPSIFQDISTFSLIRMYVADVIYRLSLKVRG